ncbi:MAG: TetR/AcrR family transcriptional regulator [Kofleriaceae bacterium]
MRKKKPALTARKQPRQGRSRHTVEAILEATTELLLKSGYDALTTNAIAARAGVNIASLYQYFPNKQAIVHELMQRHVDATRASMLPALAGVRGRGLEDNVRALVEAVAAEHAVAPKLHQIFTAIGPQIGFVRTPVANSEIEAAQKHFIKEMRGKLPDPELALWVTQTAVHAVFHTAFVERPDLATKPILIEEIVRLVTAYLEP